MGAASDTQALRAKLEARPHDPGLRAQLAAALERDGDPAGAVALLASLRNVTAHDGVPLPCLCREHLMPELVRAEVDGVAFRRGFSIARGRVLWYWYPEELADEADGMRRAVTVRLANKLRLAARRRKSW